MADSIIVDNDDWSISMSLEDECVYIKTNDYHADPLKITKSKLIELARLFASTPIQAISKPSDTQNISTGSGWTIGISKKNKLLYCESMDGIAEPLAFSRHDLYRYGKMMNKRAKISK
ncbi:MAG: hypothetical protein WA946_05145 [Nitrospirota bacterium]